MALPAANVLGNPATTTSAFQTAIEDQRQFIEDLVFSNIGGQATAGQVPNLQSLNGSLETNQINRIAAPANHTKAGTQYFYNADDLYQYIESATANWLPVNVTSLFSVPTVTKAVILEVLLTPSSNGLDNTAAVYFDKGSRSGATITPNLARQTVSFSGNTGSFRLPIIVPVDLVSTDLFFSALTSGTAVWTGRLYYRGFMTD
jgi:hypothetical protein